MAAEELSIVVISHGHAALLPGCVGSLQSGLKGVGVRALIIDNIGESLDGICGGFEFPVDVRRNQHRLGFAANVNRGLELTRSPYVLLMNPDTRFVSGLLRDAVDFLDRHPDVGVLGCRLMNPDGTRQESCRRFPTAPAFTVRVLGIDRLPWQPRFYRNNLMRDMSVSAPTQVDWVMGAFLILRRSCWEAVGGLDEKFFMYYEDVDFCYRARAAGFTTCYYPGIVVVHEHQRTSRSLTTPHAWWHAHSALRYFLKHGYAFRPVIEASP